MLLSVVLTAPVLLLAMLSWARIHVNQELCAIYQNPSDARLGHAKASLISVLLLIHTLPVLKPTLTAVLMVHVLRTNPAALL